MVGAKSDSQCQEGMGRELLELEGHEKGVVGERLKKEGRLNTRFSLGWASAPGVLSGNITRSLWLPWQKKMWYHLDSWEHM